MNNIATFFRRIMSDSLSLFFKPVVNYSFGTDNANVLIKYIIMPLCFLIVGSFVLSIVRWIVKHA